MPCVARPKTTAEVVELSKENTELRTALSILAGCDVSKLDGRRLGYALRRVKRRPANGLRFTRASTDRHEKIVRWKVEACG